MNDYPQIMAGIHKQLLDNLMAAGQLSGEPSSDRSLVDSHFTVEVLEAIRQGYEISAVDEAEEEAEGQDLQAWARSP